MRCCSNSQDECPLRTPPSPSAPRKALSDGPVGTAVWELGRCRQQGGTGPVRLPVLQDRLRRHSIQRRGVSGLLPCHTPCSDMLAATRHGGERDTCIWQIMCPAPADPRDTALFSKTCFLPWPGLARGTQVPAGPRHSETQPGLAVREPHPRRQAEPDSRLGTAPRARLLREGGNTCAHACRRTNTHTGAQTSRHACAHPHVLTHTPRACPQGVLSPLSLARWTDISTEKVTTLRCWQGPSSGCQTKTFQKQNHVAAQPARPRLSVLTTDRKSVVWGNDDISACVAKMSVHTGPGAGATLCLKGPSGGRLEGKPLPGKPPEPAGRRQGSLTPPSYGNPSCQVPPVVPRMTT